MNELLLANRGQHLRDRDLHYQQALRDLDVLVEKLRSLRDTIDGLQQLRSAADQLAASFKRAHYHAVLAAGGDFGRIRDPGISREEKVFSDYLKTLYSAARNIESHLTHELMLLRFYESETDLEARVRDYVHQAKSYDQDTVLKNVDMMVQRSALFNKAFLQIHPFQGDSRSSASNEL